MIEDIKSFKELRDRLAVPSGDVLSFADPINFLATVTYAQIAEQPIETVATGSTTVNVLNITRLVFENTVATTVTNFIGGQEGQELKILGDGYTTLQHGTNIFTNTAANKLLATNKVYTFTKFSSGWVENA